MTTDSPTFKFDLRIALLPSDSITITRVSYGQYLPCIAGQGIPETSLHLFWECPKARACVLGNFLRHWTGAIATSSVFSRCFGICANRQAPKIQVLLRSRLLEKFQDDVAAGEQVW